MTRANGRPSASRPLADTTVRSVALVRLRVGLGDLLASVPALRAIRAARPDLDVAFVTWEEMRPVVERMSSYVDELVPFPGYPGIPERPVDAAAVAPFFARMRARRFDLAVQMYGANPAADEVTRALGARTSAGFAQGPPGAEAADAGTHLRYPHQEHEIVRHLRLVEFLGAPPGSTELEFPLRRADTSEAAAVLAAHGVERRYAVVHPGATAKSRRWLPERFGAVADGLAAEGLRVVVTGVRGEEPIVRAVVGAMARPAVDLCAKTSLGAFAAILAGARLLVGNESGPAQLAAALGVPSVTLFFAGQLHRWAPLDGALHVSLAAGVPCQPCGLLECPIEFPCARELSVERVLEAAVGLARGSVRGSA